MYTLLPVDSSFENNRTCYRKIEALRFIQGKGIDFGVVVHNGNVLNFEFFEILWIKWCLWNVMCFLFFGCKNGTECNCGEGNATQDSSDQETFVVVWKVGLAKM